MVNSVNIETLVDGSRITIIKVDIIGDGSGEQASVIFDASAYFNTTVDKRLFQIQYCLVGFSAALIWGGTVPKQLITLEADHHGRAEYDWCSGLNNSSVTGHDGDISISTSGLGDGDRGYIIIEVLSQEVPVGTR